MDLIAVHTVICAIHCQQTVHLLSLDVVRLCSVLCMFPRIGYFLHIINPLRYLVSGGTMCGFSVAYGESKSWDYCLQAAKKSITNWDACIEARLHGPAHMSIAGSWRRPSQATDSPMCSQWFGFIPPPAIAPQPSAPGANSNPELGTFINAYAKGCFSCPSCSTDQSPDLCSCSPTTTLCGPL